MCSSKVDLMIIQKYWPFFLVYVLCLILFESALNTTLPNVHLIVYELCSMRYPGPRAGNLMTQ